MINKSKNSFIYQKKFDKTITIEDDLYKIIIKIDEGHSNDYIYITCNSIDENISLYNYSKHLNYNSFYHLGYSFKQCKDLDETFDLLKKILSDETIKISFNNTMELKSDYKAKILNNGDLTLILTMPLLTGKSEKIEIEFNKEQKDSVKQFEKLKKKYCSLKRMIYNRSTNTVENDEKNFIESLINEIEN